MAHSVVNTGQFLSASLSSASAERTFATRFQLPSSCCGLSSYARHVAAAPPPSLFASHAPEHGVQDAAAVITSLSQSARDHIALVASSVVDSSWAPPLMLGFLCFVAVAAIGASLYLRRENRRLAALHRSALDAATHHSLTNGILTQDINRLAAIIAAIPEPIIAADELGHVSVMNRAAEGLLRWTLAEARLRPIQEILEFDFDPDTSDVFSPHANALVGEHSTTTIWNRLIATHEPFAMSRGAFLTNRHGHRVPVLVAAAIVPTGDEATAPHTRPIYGAVFVLHNMSGYLAEAKDRRMLERFDIVRSMTEVFEHTIPIIVRGANLPPRRRSDYLSDVPSFSFPPPRPVIVTSENVAEIVGERLYLEQVPTLAQTFAHLTHPQHKSRPFRPGPLFRDLALFLPRVLGRHVTVSVAPDKDLAPAFADPAVIRRALFELSLAARARMAVGGTITFSSRQCDARPPARSLLLGELPDGLHLQLSIADSGTSYNRDQLFHLFEPFRYKTRAMVDTSFRLLLTVNAIRRMGGALVIDSRPRTGSTFTICLPIAPPTSSLPPGVGPN